MTSTSGAVAQTARRRIYVPASFAGLKQVVDWYMRFAHQFGVDAALRDDMYVAIEELVSNTIRHGSNPGIRPRITIALRLTPATLTAVVADDSTRFDPLTSPAPDTSRSVVDRPLGGLGILFVRQLMDSVRYRWWGGRNYVRLRKARQRA